MMLNILIRICMAYFLLGSYHDVPLAIFKIYNTENEVRLAINVDFADYQASTKSSGERPEITALTYYLEQHMKIELDHEIAKIKVESFSMIADHISISAVLDVSSRNFTEIAIENTVLIDIESQSNIMQIELGTLQRDFRMHRKRTQIQFCL